MDELLELEGIANLDLTDNGESMKISCSRKVDVTSREQVEASVAAVVEHFGTVEGC